MLGQGRAIRYGVGVGREGFTWSGVQTISRRRSGRIGHPPAEMIARQPYLPRFVAGGPGNPLGARAMYLGSSQYRIHGTNDPSTIGKFVSSGCIRLTNEDVADLFSRVTSAPRWWCCRRARRIWRSQRIGNADDDQRSPGRRRSRVMTTAAPGRQAMNRFDVIAVLSEYAGDRDELEIRQAVGIGSGGDAGRLGAGACRAGARISSRHCSAGSAVRVRRRSACRLPARAGLFSAGRARSARYGGGQAYCVRTCDGRYFPVTGSDNQSRAASCNSFCPASDTKVVYGSSIDNAATENGKPYSELPNAFRYRNELVAGCTCNGKDQIGLAQVKIDNDPTLRKGDIVAGEAGWWSPTVAPTDAARR